MSEVSIVSEDSRLESQGRIFTMNETRICMRHGTFKMLGLMLAILFAHDSARSQEAAPSEVTWDQVRPVFQKRCFACHRGEQARGGLDVSTVAGIKSGSTSGAAVVSGKPEESMIYTLPAHLGNPQMPPNSAKLPQRELDLIFGWIQGGMSEKVTVTDKKNTKPSRPAMNRPRPPVVRAPKPKLDGMVQTAKVELPAAVRTSAVTAVRPLSRIVTSVATSPTASLVAIAEGRQVMIYQWTDQSLVTTIPFPAGDVFTVRFSRDGTLLIVGGGIGASSGKVIGFDVATAAPVFEVGEESDVVLAADLSPDGRLVALGGPSRKVRIYNTVTGELVSEIVKHTDWVLSLAISNDGLLLATGDRFGTLLISNAVTGAPFHTLRGHTGSIHSLVWAADSNTVMSAGEDGTLRTWDMHEGVQLRALTAAAGAVLAIDADATGQFVVGGRKGKIEVWQNPEQRTQEIIMPDEVNELAMTHDGTHIIAADVTGNVGIYEASSGQKAGTFSLP